MKLLRPKRGKGFTLVELLVAIGVGSIVLGAVYGFYRTQNRSYIIQDQIAEMQQNTRMAMNILLRDIRMAGYQLSSGGCTYGDGATETTYTVTAFIAHNNDNSPDSVDICYKYESESTVSTPLRDEMPKSSAELKVESTGGFEVGDIIMITDGEYCAMLEVTQVQDASLMLQHNPGGDTINPPASHNTFPTSFGIGSMVTVLDQDFRSYFIVNNTLMLDPDGPSGPLGGDDFNPQAVAGDIEDLQLQYGLDTNGDDVVDSWDNDPTGSETQIRSVRIWILGRTRDQQPGYTDTNTYNMGDRVYQPNDAFRRRMLYSEVMVRNLGL